MERGYWQKGDLLGDPFGGIGCGGIIAASNGLRWVGVELEERFVELAKKNFELHRRTWEGFGDPQPVIVQGDSRRFAEIVGGHPEPGALCAAPRPDSPPTLNRCGELAGCVTSPPYADQSIAHEGQSGNAASASVIAKRKLENYGKYGHTPGQIGSLPAGQLDAAITSPPYAATDHKPTKMGDGKGTRATGESADRNKGDYHYPESDGQIGALREGTLDGAVTSPPWVESLNSGQLSEEAWKERERLHGSRCASDRRRELDLGRAYGHTPGQIGRESSETYWSACAAVYRQMWLALKPGGVAAIVVKDYVKQGKRVPLCDDTCRLLESLGFHVFERTRCWLVKEESHPSLFGGKVTRKKERKSFFRRLAEQKGSPRIDWEEILWCRRLDGR